ncbi:hypothetical protein B0H16DRAFT_1885526 [Mycena metata]|uniref:F-box domain-containing protein n=1 Tax=Mycena metata TaxID=1033252 RepID=A0AAD7NEG6_9AGAR|nr:hypothetical protein B0H16DRAFT_1885526 [Mycena metata]
MLAKLKQRLRLRRNTAQKSAPVLGGIGLLPFEILGSEIFPRVVHTERLYDPWHSTLLSLACVCTRWRNIVHSTPSLWNQCIWINTRQFSGLQPSRRNRLVEKYFEALRMCLTRSAPLLVSISIDWSAFEPDRKDFARAVDLISDAAARIEFLRVSSLCKDDAGVCVLRALERLPTLQALTEIEFSFLGGAVLQPFSVMNAPRLRRVNLSAGPDPLNLVSFPWPQLTHLTLAARPLACLAVLAKCSNSVSAVLHHMYTFEPNDTAPTATLLHLTSLSLTVSATLIQAAGNLNLPALTSLELIYDGNTMMLPHLEIFSHLPFGNVRRLTLEFYGAEMIGTATLCALLHCTPSVTAIILKSTTYIHNALVNALVLRADVRSKLFIPQLEFFSIGWSVDNGDLDLEQLKAMLGSWVVGAGLRRVVYKEEPYHISALVT